MFQKILIAEDHGITSSGLKKTISKLSISIIDTTYYCDDALLRVKAALQKDTPYELLITDLSFKEDHRSRNLQSGEALIEAIKKIQPKLKILVYSVEHRISKISDLLENYNINGFVGKERKDLHEIGKAINEIYSGKIYLSKDLQQLLLNSDSILELDDYDICTLKLLSEGLKQEEIARYFQEKNYPASSLRSIQDRLSKLKIFFKAKTSAQLVAQAIEKGFI